jgi:demethylmenaquinone methyltransferase/2-methoxy-6-polyprenyl-1,4-benzoquinol methylase
MLRHARRKAERQRRPSRVTPQYVPGDIMALPFEDASFDIVSIAFGIRNVSDPPRALGEFRRVLRPSGRLIILEFGQPANRWLRLLNDLYCGHIMPLTATLLAGDRTGAYRYLPRSVATFADRAQLAAMMKDAGFVGLTQHPMTFGVCVASLGHVAG